MKEIKKAVFLILLVCLSTIAISCKRDLETDLASPSAKAQLQTTPKKSPHRIIDIREPLKELGFWKYTKVEGKANTVVLELSRNVDLLFWTKENGEVLDIDRPRLNAEQSLYYAATDKPCTFTFKEPGTYILNIYQKPNKEDNFNIEDVDYRGKVVVGQNAVKITDTGYADKCRKQARYIISNFSNTYSDGNVMTELVFASSLGRKWDYERRRNYAVYKAEYKYSNLYLEPGKSIIMLLPIGESINDTRQGKAILKPVVKDGETFYYIQTTNLVLLGTGETEFSKRLSKQGTMGAQHNGVLTYVNNDCFEMPWN